MGFENVGKVWDLPGFRDFLMDQDLSWASGITLHHTFSPSLAQRPQGFKIQHMRNLENYYKNELGWSAGPHLFVDEDQVFGLSSLERRGVHAKSFNATHIGIEVLGDYDGAEDPKSGRGLACWKMAMAVVGAFPESIGGSSWNFHRDDPLTSKTCPGKLVEKEWVASLIPLPDDRNDDVPENAGFMEDALSAIEWQIGKIRKSL